MAICSCGLTLLLFLLLINGRKLLEQPHFLANILDFLLSGNLAASFRSIGGGEIVEYTKLVDDTRRQAMDRLMYNAGQMGANAVVMMRFDSGEIAQGMNEVVAYGTAVVIEPLSTYTKPPSTYTLPHTCNWCTTNSHHSSKLPSNLH